MKLSKDYLKDLDKYKNEKIVVICDKVKKFEPKPDPILLKLQPDPHPLSREEQIFFIKLTEGAFGFNEHIRNVTLQTLARDYNVRFLAPYLCLFVQEAIRVNIVFPDLSLLIYSVRMAKSLMANPHVRSKEYLHIILPAILSCVLSKKISKYNHDNHWTLRDFSAQVVSTICCTYNNKINQIKGRVIKLYIKAIQDCRKSLNSIYGGLKGLSCFGEETVKVCVIPLLPFVSRRLCHPYVVDGSAEAKQVKRITDLILTITGPILLRLRNVNDGGASYARDFGFLGYALYQHVKNLEKSQVFLICQQ